VHRVYVFKTDEPTSMKLGMYILWVLGQNF